MTENRFAHGASAGAAADGPPLSLKQAASPAPAADDETPGDEDEHAFATEAEEIAYWQGVADGIRNHGGIVPPRLAARAAGQQLLVPMHQDPPRDGEGDRPPQPEAKADGGGGSPCAANSENPLRQPCGPPPPRPAEDPADDILHFTPAQLHYRSDGWTPQRQVEFVEALADTGIIRAAAARVNMTEQSVSRLRRRASARGFDAARTATQRLGARRLASIAYERAIEGTVKRHYFHGELKAEERVYDNRLLIALINKLPDLHEPDPAADAVAANWETWMDAIGSGLDSPPPAAEPAMPDAAEPAPKPEPEPEPEPGPEPEPEPFEATVWEDEGALLTDCPPPGGFDLYEDGKPGDAFYQRYLTPAEQDYWEETGEEAAFEDFGFSGTFYRLGRSTFFPWGSEPSEPSSLAEPAKDAGGAREPGGESKRGPDGGPAPDASGPSGAPI